MKTLLKLKLLRISLWAVALFSFGFPIYTEIRYQQSHGAFTFIGVACCVFLLAINDRIIALKLDEWINNHDHDSN